MKKKVISIIVVVILLIQFFPFHNNTGETLSPKNITSVVATDSTVLEVLKESCFDCHSNNSSYPWYSYVQPVGWWINYHISEGKHELNFSEFANYSMKRKLHKMKEIVEVLEEDEMPIRTYTFMHSNAKLSASEKKLIIDWVQVATQELKADSLINP